MLTPSVWKSDQERQRVLIGLLRKHLNQLVSDTCVLEIGCGIGGNLLELIRKGFLPKNLIGNELLPDRAQTARNNLPILCQIDNGDACLLDYPPESMDIVYQSTVFSSLLDDVFQKQLADRMWHWLKPGGAVLWYDFIYNNPWNPDVSGIPIKRIRALFPQSVIETHKITLAPPISRRVCLIHPMMYSIFNVLPLLRTHVLCWIQKKS